MASTAASSSYSKYEIRRRDPNPSSAALLVIDLQNFFASTAAPILPSVRATVSLCRSVGIPVLFTRHRHLSGADPSTLGEWWHGELILDGTHDSLLLQPELVDRLQDDLVIEKSTYSAFAGTGLEEELRSRGIEEVIVAGVMTNLCCETTARDAFVRGFRVFFSTDATGTAKRELHEATLMNLAYGFSYLVDCERLEKGFGKKG